MVRWSSSKRELRLVPNQGSHGPSDAGDFHGASMVRPVVVYGAGAVPSKHSRAQQLLQWLGYQGNPYKQGCAPMPERICCIKAGSGTTRNRNVNCWVIIFWAKLWFIHRGWRSKALVATCCYYKMVPSYGMNKQGVYWP